ncbi:unnamed protein product [Nesidiocoris tenuis]|uniref:Zinc finger PHD-type domain-containing protein n=1 Tax=Nesidiocoris tenuis TaxID=355587 RepID=A0A6H5GID3_9HEMI|nr:unnamed protein product [Nesidiocoris tenuis]
MSCANCLDPVSPKNAIPCSNCSKTFHPGCTRIGTLAKYKKLNTEARRKWKCGACKSKNSLRPTVNKSSEDNTSDAESEGDLDEITEQRIPSAAKLNSTMLALSAQMRTIGTTMIEFERSLNFVSAKFDETSAKLDTLTGTINSLSKDNDELKKENQFLKGEVWNLKRSVNELQQDKFKNSVEITGIPEVRNENLLSILTEIGLKLNAPVEAKDITSTYRIPSSQRDKSRRIAVNFVDMNTKKMWIEAIKKHKDFSAKDVHNSFSNASTRIYINDQLTPDNRRLFWMSRRFAAEYQFKFCWTTEGRILLKKDEGSPTIRIRDESDIWKLDGGRALLDKLNNQLSGSQ